MAQRTGANERTGDVYFLPGAPVARTRPGIGSAARRLAQRGRVHPNRPTVDVHYSGRVAGFPALVGRATGGIGLVGGRVSSSVRIIVPDPQSRIVLAVTAPCPTDKLTIKFVAIYKLDCTEWSKNYCGKLSGCLIKNPSRFPDKTGFSEGIVMLSGSQIFQSHGFLLLQS
jgi:hypothetical protein